MSDRSPPRRATSRSNTTSAAGRAKAARQGTQASTKASTQSGSKTAMKAATSSAMLAEAGRPTPRAAVAASPRRGPVRDIPARRRRKEARPQELMDAALELFVEKGFAATRIEEIASRAGVSKGTMYLYFPGKEDLLKAVIRHHLGAPITEAAAQVDTLGGRSEDILGELMRHWWTQVIETPASGIFKLMMSEVRNFPDLAQFYVDEVISPTHALLGRLITRGMEAGEFRRLPVRDLVHALIAPMLFMAMHKHSFACCPGAHDDIDPHSFIDTQIRLILQGLRAQDPASGSAV